LDDTLKALALRAQEKGLELATFTVDGTWGGLEGYPPSPDGDEPYLKRLRVHGLVGVMKLKSDRGEKNDK